MRQSGNTLRRRPFRPDNIKKFKVQADGMLLETVATVLKDHKPSKLKSMLKHHQFAVNGSPCSQFDRQVMTDDELWINFDGSFRIFSHPKIKLIYEDNDIMVVDKGCGILSTSAGKIKDDTVFSVIRNYVKVGNEQAHVYMVHRLDRDTSGLMLLARSAKARDKMVKQWGQLVVARKYEAIVEGLVEDERGSVENYLQDADNYEVVSTTTPNEGAQFAKTLYEVIRRSSRTTHVELSMHKGHKNQLRVHMKDIGHPICGDRKYGGHSNPIHRLALHATKLTIIHPVTGKELSFESPIPEKFMKLM